MPDEYPQTNGDAECQAEKERAGSPPFPIDGLFKTLLTHTDTARDFLALQLCDLTTLQLESGENLRTYFADVLYSLKYH